MIKVDKLNPFGRMCISMGMIPSSYKESLTYEEQLMWFCNYLEKTVIPAVNNNADALIELQGLYNEIKTYVDEYFENLDVQEEINNKLDDMAESGELTELIAQYLGLAGMITFDTVAEMKLAENLVDGSKCTTLGYHSANDGGSATYKVREVTNEDVVDEMFIIALSDLSLVAELIIEYPINPLCLGAYGDGTHDDYTVLQSAINKGNVKLIKGSYYTSDMIIIPTNRIFDGNNNYIIPASGKYALGTRDYEHAPREIVIRDLLINTAINEGSNGIYLDSSYFVYIDNVNIFNLKGNNTIGIKQVNGFNIIIRNSRVYGDTESTGQIGIEITCDTSHADVSFTSNMTNNKYENLLLQVLEYGVKANYTVTCNTVNFNNIGFSSCDYCYYIQGICDPIVFKDSRMEYSGTGFYFDGSVNATIDSFNIYNVEKGIENTNSRKVIIIGSCSATGTNQDPKYFVIDNSNNIINIFANFYVTGNTYTVVRSTGITSNGKISPHTDGALVETSANNIQGSATEIAIYKISATLINMYGIKGTKLLFYTAESNIKVAGSGASTTHQGSEITLTPNKMYTAYFIDTNKFIVGE